MSITIDLTPEQEARLSEKATQRGVALADYAREVVLKEAEPDDWLSRLYSMGIVTGISLSNDAVSSEGLYEDDL